MPRPSIKQGPKKKKPTSLPSPKLGKSGPPKPRSSETKVRPEVAKAKVAVRKFEEELAVFHKMRAAWSDDYPEAASALEDLKRQQDTVEEACKKAKPLVAKAKVDIGDFTAQRKYKSAHYDDEVIMQMMAAAEDAGVVMEAFLEGGIVTSIALDKDATTAWFAQHPEFAERFNSAWVEEVEMTTAVTVPKF